MSIADELANIAELAGKQPGFLLRAEDWNTLIASLVVVRDVVDGLQGNVATLQNDLTILGDQVVTLDERVTELEPLLPLRTDYYRVTLESGRVSFAIGELAEITARVTDIAGDPLDFRERPRPWVDFVSSWGRLRAAPGFTSREGVGDNSLSVQVNSEGIARITLRSEHAEGLSAAQEDQVLGALQSTLPVSGEPLLQAILAAPTPTDAKAHSAYRIIDTEYERSGSPLKAYLDGYHIVNQNRAGLNLYRPPTGRWRDYRSTIMAFVKNDRDPLTPDHTRGTATMQVTFRDWINFWLADYVGRFDEIVDGLVRDFRPDVSPDVTTTIGRWTDRMFEFNKDAGSIGRQRNFRAMGKAMEDFDIDDAPAYLAGLKDDMNSAIFMQSAIDPAESGAETYRQAALAVHSQTNSRVAAVGQSVDAVGETTFSHGQQIGEFQTSFTNLNVRMNNTEDIGRGIQQNLGNIETKVQAINVLDAESLQRQVIEVSANIGQIRNLLGR